MSQRFYTQSKVVIIPSELGWIDLYEQPLKNNFSLGNGSTIKNSTRETCHKHKYNRVQNKTICRTRHNSQCDCFLNKVIDPFWRSGKERTKHFDL